MLSYVIWWGAVHMLDASKQVVDIASAMEKRKYS